MALTEIPIELSSTPSIVDGGNATAITIDSSENVGIGTGSPSAPLTVAASSGGNNLKLTGRSADGYAFLQYGNNADNVVNAEIGVSDAKNMQFFTNSSERMRMDSSGRLLVNTASILSGSSAKIQVLQNVTDEWSTRLNNSSASPFGLTVGYSATPNNTANYFLYMSDGTAGRFQVASNGNVGSATSSYGGMSDLKLKENIVDAGSQWDDLKAVRVRKYSFKEENSSEPTQIGVIAQEVEAAGMAGLVYESPDQIKADDGSIEGTGEVTKNMKYSILYMKAIKALQEAMERIETLEAKVQTLENN